MKLSGPVMGMRAPCAAPGSSKNVLRDSVCPAYGLFRITDRVSCQAWLRRLLAGDAVTAASRGDVGRGTVLNIAFTASVADVARSSTLGR